MALLCRKHFAPELAENMLVRFIHNGRELHHDASTLQACNIRDGAVIHALLTRAHREEQPDPEQVRGMGAEVVQGVETAQEGEKGRGEERKKG